MNNKLFVSPSLRKAMGLWLSTSFEFTHFITLTTHNCQLGPGAMRNRLKDWDAQINRALYGPKWHKHADELLGFFAFLEKPTVNPHWHLLVRIVGRWGSDPADDFRRLPVETKRVWKRITPGGTTDVQSISPGPHSTVEEYVAKELRGGIQYSDFIVPDQLRY